MRGPSKTLTLPASIERFLDSIDSVVEVDRYPGPDELERVLDDWARRGALVEPIGRSRGGRTIRAATIGQGEQGLLVWGYPHSDEPLGALALVALGEALLTGGLELPGWRCHLILCADPDEAARNLWFDGPRTMYEFVHGCWRPENLGLEVDYGFPLDAGPFVSTPDFQGRCRSRAECALVCGGGECTRQGLPFTPLPESRALAQALERYRPRLVAAMHNAGLGGDYTFLLTDEPEQVLDDLLTLPSRYGQPRHLGEPLDEGRPWRADAPDLIREPRLQEAIAWLERQPGYDPRLVYEDSHSAGNYIEARLPGTQFVCPEVCQYRHPAFADTSPSGQEETVLAAVEARASGRLRLAHVKVDGEWVLAEQEPAGDAVLSAPREERRPTSRAMLGVRAVYRRRHVLAAADRLWASVLQAGDLVEHPYLDERWAQTTPGRLAGEEALQAFRTRAEYRESATVAQVASFAWAWPYHTAVLLGNFQNFLRRQDLTRPELAAVKEALDQLQAQELAALPAEVQVDAPRAPALRSQLARLLRLTIK